MGKLVYAAICSLDGYIADANGNFDWAEPDDEVHAAVNDVDRSLGTYLYGRKLYEFMVPWESLDLAGQRAVMRDFAEWWRAANKVVYSRTLTSVSTGRTRLEPEFDVDAVRRMKASTQRDLGIGGSHLAAEAFEAGIVDDIHLFVNPILVGGGNAALPSGVRLALGLV